MFVAVWTSWLGQMHTGTSPTSFPSSRCVVPPKVSASACTIEHVVTILHRCGHAHVRRWCLRMAPDKSSVGWRHGLQRPAVPRRNLRGPCPRATGGELGHRPRVHHARLQQHVRLPGLLKLTHGLLLFCLLMLGSHFIMYFTSAQRLLLRNIP